MSGLKKQLIINTCSGWLARLSSGVVGFIMIPYNIRHLGEDAYGISVLAVSAIAILEFLQLGMGPALLRFFSKARADGDSKRMQTLASTAQVLLGGLGLLGAVVLYCMIPWFIRFYEVPETQWHDTRVLLCCMGGAFFIHFLALVFYNIALASNRYDLSNVRLIAESWLRLGLLVVLYHVFTPSLACLGVALLCSSLFGLLGLFAICYRENGRNVLFSRKAVSLAILPEIFSFGFLALISSVFFSASIQVPVLIIGKTLGSNMVAAFAPGITLATFLASILTQISVPLAPLAANDKSKNDGGNIGRWAILMSQAVSFVGYGCIMGSILFIPEVLLLWMGNNFIWTSAVVTVLITGIVFAKIQTVNVNLAIGASTIAPSAYSSVVMALLTSTGTWLGTAYWNWGLLEVAICITSVRILRNTFFLAWIYSRLFQYSYIHYFYKVYVKPAIVTLPILFPALLIQYVNKHFFGDTGAGIVMLGVKIAAVGMIYLAMVWHWGLDADLKSAFRFKKQARA